MDESLDPYGRIHPNQQENSMRDDDVDMLRHDFNPATETRTTIAQQQYQVVTAFQQPTVPKLHPSTTILTLLPWCATGIGAVGCRERQSPR